MNDPATVRARPAAARIRPPAGARRGRLSRVRRQPAGLCAHPRLSALVRAADRCCRGRRSPGNRTSRASSPTASGAETPAPEALEDLARAGGDAPLIIEDADRRGYPEPALFHLLNQSMRDHRPLLHHGARADRATGRTAPRTCCSRARLAALFTVSAPDDIQLSQMLVKLFGDRQVTVDPKVVAYLVARMERSPEEAVILVELLDRLALARGTAITRCGCGRGAGAARRVAARTRPGRRRDR